MRHIVTILALVWGLNSFAFYNLGDVVANHCWDDAQGNAHCIADQPTDVRVLVFSVGWCGPCKTEARDIAKAWSKYATKPVTFLSILGEDESQRSPSASFLNRWQKNSGLQWPILGKHREYGQDFFARSAFPSIVVIDRGGKVTWKSQGANTQVMFQKIDEALAKNP